MSSEEYVVPPKVPALKVTGFVFYAGGASDPLTTTAPSIEKAISSIRYRWAKNAGYEHPPLGARVQIINSEEVFVYQKIRVRARTEARALAAR